MKFIRFIYFFILAFILVSCNKDEIEPYDHPFIHIMKDNTSSEVVSSKAFYTAEYYVYLSSRPLPNNLIVNYKIIVGTGLKEGVDYKMINTSHSLEFLPGIYQMPIRIKWMPNKLDSKKDNTLTIELENNSMDLTMGLPGKDHFQREFTIIKKN